MKPYNEPRRQQLTLKYKKKGAKAQTVVEDVTSLKTGYAHLHYKIDGSPFEHCITYKDVESFTFSGEIPDKWKDRKERELVS
jgi:hypothetical protein